MKWKKLQKKKEQIQQLIKLNREYQDVLRMCVKQTEAAKQRNIELQKKLRSITQSNRTRRGSSKKTHGSPFFGDGQNDMPAWNIDTHNKIEQENKMPIHFKFKRWTQQERKNLENAVIQQNKKLMYSHLFAEGRNNPDGRKMSEIGKWANEQVNSLPDDHFKENVKGLDWDIISSQYVPTRSSMDCKLQWINNDHPSINKSNWTKHEDKQLLALAKKYKNLEWELIAQELNTRRTPFQCFKRYQRSLNTAIVKGKWSPQEDEMLRKAIQQCGDKNWQQIANYLNGRTGQQCLHRWQKNSSP